MSTPNADNPRAGDIVVYKPTAPAERYVLSVFRHASQLVFRTHDEAMRDATAFATKDHVDAWYTEDGQMYQRMAMHRLQRHRMPAAD